MPRDLGDEPYLSLASFRRDGREVRTPVWVARDGEELVVYTNGRSGKVKRIRREGRVRLAACDARGGLRGEWLEGRARLRDDATARDRGVDAIRSKYGWQAELVLLGARLFGRYPQRAVIAIRLGEGGAAAPR
jgi:PPOX class probable F420-dependent enzyme